MPGEQADVIGHCPSAVARRTVPSAFVLLGLVGELDRRACACGVVRSTLDVAERIARRRLRSVRTQSRLLRAGGH